ncbi:MAG TPA: CsbD family protein [Microbacteriaceae bacterium]|nr:CsbD family protein [Microbacteriaceae bacterium]
MGAGEKMEAGWDKAKGKVKESVGDMTDNEKMEAEGKLDQAKGRAKEAKEDVKDAVKDAFND